MGRTGLRGFGVAILLIVSCGGGRSAPATPDVVEAGTDVAAPECVGHHDCDDHDPCTTDTCLNGTCRHEPVLCDDQNICTDDACGPQGCVFTKKPGCCVADAECDDADLCTKDRCLLHACVHDRPDPTCCSKHEECDDGNPCTFDYCDQGHCGRTPISGPDCCTSDQGCFDSNPCTNDQCINGKCVYTSAGCCVVDEDCEDLNPCTTGTCNSKGQCEYTTKKGCCAKDEDCDDQNDCTSEVCKNQVCEWNSLVECCRKNEDCAVSDPCKAGTCKIPAGETSGVCVFTVVSSPECCTTTLLSAGFDSGLDGFETAGLYGASKPGWGVDSKRFVSPPNSLYFGDPATHTYDAGMQPVGGTATSPEVDLSKTWEPVVRFMLWKQTEVVASSDVLAVEVLAGGEAHRVWSTASFPEFSDTGGVFVPVQVPLQAFSDQVVRIRFVFDTLTGFANAYEGVYLDDIEVVGRCL